MDASVEVARAYFMLVFLSYILICLIGSNHAVESKIKFCQVYNMEVLTCYWDVIIVNNNKVSLDLYYKKGCVATSIVSLTFSTSPLNLPTIFVQSAILSMTLTCHLEQTHSIMFHFIIFQSFSRDILCNDARDIPLSQLLKCKRSESTDTNGSTDWCSLHYKNHTIIHIPYTFILKSHQPSILPHSSPLCLTNIYDIYKAGTVREITVSNISSTTALVRWKAPNPRPHLCDVVYHASDAAYKSLNSSNNKVSLSGLPPYTLHHLSIRCIRLLSSPRGVWSDWVESSFNTLPDVPATWPKVFAGGYKRLRANVFKVIWQEIAGRFKNGKISKTRVRTIITCDTSLSSAFKNIKESGLNAKYCGELQEAVKMATVTGSGKKGDLSGGCAKEAMSTREIDGEVDEVVVEVDEECGGMVFVDMATSKGYNASLNVQALYIPPRKQSVEGIDPHRVNATVNGDGDFRLEWESTPTSHFYRLFYWLPASDTLARSF